MYSRFKAVKNATDFVVIAANPASDETGRSATRAAQLAWAREFNESYFDGYSLFQSYSSANSKGFMEDTVHLNSAGTAMRNNFLWRSLALGNEPLGRSPISGNTAVPQFENNEFGPSWRFIANTSFGSTTPMFAATPIGVPGSINVYAASYANGLGTSGAFAHDGTNVVLRKDGSVFAFSGTSSLLGWHPSFDNAMLGGRGNFKWRGAFTGVSLGYVAQTANYTLTTGDFTVNVTANSPTITLPAATASSSGTTPGDNVAAGITGKVFVVKNSGNGTVTMATTSSQTIDGSAPGTLATGASLKVQSTGSAWITIP
jgi:hypothetical protein